METAQIAHCIMGTDTDDGIMDTAICTDAHAVVTVVLLNGVTEINHFNNLNAAKCVLLEFVEYLNLHFAKTNYVLSNAFIQQTHTTLWWCVFESLNDTQKEKHS